MKTIITLFLIFALFFAGYSQSDLKIYGSLREVMQENDTSEKVRLNLMGPIFNYYGLGAVAGLDGEILILNGETYVTRVFDGSLATDKSTDVGAALLVMSSVDAWDTLKVDADIHSLKELEDHIESLGYEDAFPFMVLSGKSIIRWHVIRPPESGEEAKNHKDLGVKGKYQGESIILGFYSDSHQGMFTHHGEKLHMHFQSADKLYAGHVDEVMIYENDKLLIPKYLQK
jgi:acetolactate decarboxylase